jgi:uncharacterized protein YfbU (UPF0304 family)
MDYVQHMINDGRWADLAELFDDEHEGGNSHSPRLGPYRRMLDVFTPICWQETLAARGYERLHLTGDELKAIAEGRSWREPSSKGPGQKLRAGSTGDAG